MARTSTSCTGDASEPDRSGDGRLMYYEHQVRRSDYYSGPLDDMSDDEARALVEEAFSYAGFADPLGFPLPPAGLPGHLHKKYDYAEPAANLLSIGVAYLSAVVRNERRAMHNRWEEARQLIRDIEERAEEAVYQRWAREQMERDRKAPAVARHVYFIGAASGPIKIGIATRPRARLSELQTSHHEKLEILATCEGNLYLEKSYHTRFAAHRLQGEWFKRAPEIEAEIERLRANATA